MSVVYLSLSIVACLALLVVRRTKSHSDILHFQVLGTSTIVLNSWSAANELLSCRSAHYSGRHPSPMLNQLMGWDAILTFIPYGEDWRTHRRMFWQEFGPTNTANQIPAQTKYVRVFLQRLLDEPSEFLPHLRYALSATIVSIAYGFEIQEKSDPIVTRSDAAHRYLFAAGLPGEYLVDHLPFLKYLPTWTPFANFLRFARRAREDLEAMIEAPLTKTRSLMLQGNVAPSFVSRSLNDQDDNSTPLLRPDQRVIRNVASSAFAGGSETTSSTLGIFFAAMVLFPEVQKKSQAELDLYLDSRLPALEDRRHLPYLSAVVLETLRWRPILPLAVAHLSIVEDEYKGFRIPKNSIIYSNSWAILHDEAEFPDSHVFKPERFIKDGKVDSHLEAIVQACFGFGRRICPGRHMALNALWLYIASVLTAFDIEQTAETNVQFFWAFITPVEPFKCSIKPRSPLSEELIRNANL
ncbi:hypothetical protein ONZ45_g1167 [Pleurotus djamor]|nr:hypothetical protein ONZ45_g1167 [Pleurotus djamor]